MENYKAYVVGNVPIWKNHNINVVGSTHLFYSKLIEGAYEVMIHLANNVQDRAKELGANTVLIHQLNPVIATSLVYMAKDQQFYMNWGIVESIAVKPTVNHYKLPPNTSIPPEIAELIKKASKTEFKDGQLTIIGKATYICHSIHWL